ncbi:MAG: amidohydrolase family protein [Kutzneria sp.]|nr:amidohydrolase family protein [Kutzneria sp.]MBV9845276.1 amidohydrolase family protein [Kutzneria sp.]
MSGELLIRSVRPWPSSTDTSVVDVYCDGGTIVAMGPGLARPRHAEEVDGRGGVLLPAFTDAHARVDSAEHLIAAVAAGTTLLRGRVVLDGHGAADDSLESLTRALSARDTVRGRATVQIVACPRLMSDGSSTVALLDSALGAGADLIGGADPVTSSDDPVRLLDAMFELAEKRQCGVDLSLTASGEPGVAQLELVCERAAALDMRGRVTVTHCHALAGLVPARRDELIDALADSNVAVVTTADDAHEPLPLRDLRRAGVRVGLGQDGAVDMLERTWHLVSRGGYTADSLVEMCVDTATRGGAAVLGERDHGLVEGDRADLVVLPGDTVADVASTRPARTLVVHDGRLVG